jgi:hypothetical protein
MVVSSAVRGWVSSDRDRTLPTSTHPPAPSSNHRDGHNNSDDNNIHVPTTNCAVTEPRVGEPAWPDSRRSACLWPTTTKYSGAAIITKHKKCSETRGEFQGCEGTTRVPRVDFQGCSDVTQPATFEINPTVEINSASCGKGVMIWLITWSTRRGRTSTQCMSWDERQPTNN